MHSTKHSKQIQLTIGQSLTHKRRFLHSPAFQSDRTFSTSARPRTQHSNQPTSCMQVACHRPITPLAGFKALFALHSRMSWTSLLTGRSTSASEAWLTEYTLLHSMIYVRSKLPDAVSADPCLAARAAVSSLTRADYPLHSMHDMAETGNDGRRCDLHVPRRILS